MINLHDMYQNKKVFLRTRRPKLKHIAAYGPSLNISHMWYVPPFSQ